ncbi:hypothetical protein [Actinomadura violacea]|uniref:Uncharacterized protein n=1 Tax=Actinomadura violacea TaxID=2819934 RepID=A0ABS3RYM5_9ACTN|nr:hypothetical protein [Actinomadura violacea]MBO2461139.1 hypothetical protein [Actinomadura violacea]
MTPKPLLGASKIGASMSVAGLRLLGCCTPRAAVSNEHGATQPAPKIPVESAELSRRDRRELAAGLARLADLTRKHGEPATAARIMWGDQ